MWRWPAEQQRQQTNAWSPGQKILNNTGARVPEHTFNQPVPITARIVWADDGEEYIETEAAGWTGRLVYVRVPIPAIGSPRCGQRGGRPAP